MNLFRPRDTQAIAALRDGFIELGTRVILMETLLEQTRSRPYRTREVRKDAASFKRAKANTEAQLRAAVGRGV